MTVRKAREPRAALARPRARDAPPPPASARVLYRAARLLGRLVSCPACSTLCRRFTASDADGELFDLDPRDHDLAAVAVGLDFVMSQGFGVNPGRRHKCPPAVGGGT